jgi:Flp pilus assembly secretin CpaC
MGALSKNSKVGDAVKYNGLTITTVSKVETHGINTRVTLANGFSVVVAGLAK